MTHLVWRSADPGPIAAQYVSEAYVGRDAERHFKAGVMKLYGEPWSWYLYDERSGSSKLVASGSAETLTSAQHAADRTLDHYLKQQTSE